jgi:Domain of unknown function (DUF6048)
MIKLVILLTLQTLRSLLISISIIALLSFDCLGQGKKEKDSVSIKDFIPTGIRFGTDFIALIKSSYDKSYRGWEVDADVDLYRYFLVVELGSWKRNFSSGVSQYSNNGNYFRVGADFNFLHKDTDGNALFLGARYARSVFSEDYATLIEDPVWGTSEVNFRNTDANANWLEVTAGLRVKIWKVLWLGYTARFKFGLNIGNTPEMLPHDIPGYGQNIKQSTWGFNYLVLVRLPLRFQNRTSSKK